MRAQWGTEWGGHEGAGEPGAGQPERMAAGAWKGLTPSPA